MPGRSAAGIWLLVLVLICAVVGSATAQTSLAPTAVPSLAPTAVPSLESLLPRLGESFGAQATAAEALGGLADPRALPVLRALGAGRLARNLEGQLAIDGRDPLTGAPVSGILETLTVNNRVRVALRGAIGRLAIVSPDPAERSAAAEAVFRTRSADNVPLLEAALARETDARHP